MTFIDTDEYNESRVPRPVKLEWFSKWDAWYILSDSLSGPLFLRSCKGSKNNIVTFIGLPATEYLLNGKNLEGVMESLNVGWVTCCLPIEKTGFPSSVGWDVVE
jgi:hypothetical protein